MTPLSRKPPRRWIASVVFVVALAAAAVAFRKPLTAWFGGKSMGGSMGTAVTAHAGGFTLKASLDPDPPGTEGNALLLELHDANGKPVDDATVAVLYDMPAMGSMAEMKGNAKIEHQSDGRYRAEFDLPMAGTFALKNQHSSAERDHLTRLQHHGRQQGPHGRRGERRGSRYGHRGRHEARAPADRISATGLRRLARSGRWDRTSPRSVGARQNRQRCSRRSVHRRGDEGCCSGGAEGAWRRECCSARRRQPGQWTFDPRLAGRAT